MIEFLDAFKNGDYYSIIYRTGNILTLNTIRNNIKSGRSPFWGKYPIIHYFNEENTVRIEINLHGDEISKTLKSEVQRLDKFFNKIL